MTTIDLAFLETHVAVHDLIARFRDFESTDIGDMLLLVAESLDTLERAERNLQASAGS
jgi:hypothetical protein